MIGKPSDYYVVEGDLPYEFCQLCRDVLPCQGKAFSNGLGNWVCWKCGVKWNQAQVGGKALAILLLSLLFSPIAQAQSGWFIEGRGGVKTGLGYQFPSSSLGMHMEHPVSKRLELQEFVRWSPTNKQYYRSGNSALIGSRAVVGVSPYLAFTGGIRKSWLWTKQFSKTIWIPSLGLRLGSHRQRFYFDYTFPTGCEWATINKPCVIQSNRLHGSEVAYEQQVSPRWIVGAQVGVYNFKDQSNPAVPNMRTSHTRATVDFFARFRLA